jgi:hypothetical protein
VDCCWCRWRLRLSPCACWAVRNRTTRLHGSGVATSVTFGTFKPPASHLLGRCLLDDQPAICDVLSDAIEPFLPLAVTATAVCTALRVEHDWRLADVAKLLGVGKSTIYADTAGLSRVGKSKTGKTGRPRKVAGDHVANRALCAARSVTRTERFSRG